MKVSGILSNIAYRMAPYEIGTYRMAPYEIGTYRMAPYEIGAYEIGTYEIGAYRMAHLLRIQSRIRRFITRVKHCFQLFHLGND
jgi:hypothetical protein